MEAIHVVNAVLWQPGEQTQNFRHAHAYRPTDYYNPGRGLNIDTEDQQLAHTVAQ